MKQPISFFGIGIITACFVFLIANFFIDDTAETAEELSYDELVAAAQKEGYRVISEDDYISMTVNKNGNDEKAEDEANDENQDTEEENKDEDAAKEDEEKEEKKKEEKKKEEEKKEEPKKFKLNVKSGMLSPEISQILEDNDIIDDASAFNRFIEDEGYATYIQLGEHELTDQMTDEEIAVVITKNRRP
ncbi:hypothetical protein AB4Y30_09955 [Ornithinibacillus sp. 4-3]|uniref:YceG-like family protein n=1 Tax=Ornithinibacillus sp. 4-3 TaxID=3231488 RepID=A0AB39HLE1_9BACI